MKGKRLWFTITTMMFFIGICSSCQKNQIEKPGPLHEVQDVEDNRMIIWYLSQKSPETYTSEEMEEIHRILIDTTKNPLGQEASNQMYQIKGMETARLFQDMLERVAMNQLFRGYSAALQTKYAADVSRVGEIEHLCEYFYKDTWQRLVNEDGTTDFDQLNRLMELNPDSITLGDFNVFSEVFDRLMTDTERESVDAANQFLANCYINGKSNPGQKQDAERSPVFDQWCTYYLKVNRTTASDIKILKEHNQDLLDFHVRFMKQALLQILSSDGAMKLQVKGGFYPENSDIWSERLRIFDVDFLIDKRGDYRFTMHQSYRESGKPVEIEYYRYRNSPNMRNMIALSDLLRMPDKSSIPDELEKYNDGKRMGAYQQSGQVMYVNGIRVVNNGWVDERRLNELVTGFELQISEENRHYIEFFPRDGDAAAKNAIEEGLRDCKSKEYENAFVNWYYGGVGDAGHKSGRMYQP